MGGNKKYVYNFCKKILLEKTTLETKVIMDGQH
jgi:hypothetical protein